MSDSDGYHGIQQPQDTSDEAGAQSFTIRRILDGRHFCALVKVVSVEIPGGLALAGTVDVQLLVNQIDGQGKALPHDKAINGLLYWRMQGGANAIIMDPEVGDIGVCIFSDLDNSSVIASRAQANPGSARRSDLADGIYLGGMLNAIPTQFVMFTEDGIEINSPTEVKLIAPKVTVTTGIFTVNGPSQFNGTVDASDTITAPLVDGKNDVIFGGKSGVGHVHSGVNRGNSNTDKPA